MSAILIPTFTNLMEQNKQKIINIYNEPKKVYMLNGKEITEEESKQMFADLLKYCWQDTYAMVLLMDVLYKFAEG